MRTETRMPWEMILGMVILAASLVPIWLLDLQQAPTETQIRFWTTVITVVALWGIWLRLTLFRWALLVLLGTGIVVSVWSFVTARTIEIESALITVAQTVGLALLFSPHASAWLRARTAGQGTAG